MPSDKSRGLKINLEEISTTRSSIYFLAIHFNRPTWSNPKHNLPDRIRVKFYCVLCLKKLKTINNHKLYKYRSKGKIYPLKQSRLNLFTIV